MRKFEGISSFTLHILAMLFMLCDHIWATLVAGNMWLTCIGRMAFPIFAFLLAEGFCLTHNRKKYFIRLLVLALVSEIPFNLIYDGGIIYPFHQNVVWTLLIAFGCMSFMEKIRQKGKLGPMLVFIPAAALFGWIVGTITMVDYFGGGVLTVLVFYLFRGRKWWQIAGQAAGLFLINCVLLGGMYLPMRVGGFEMEIPQQGFALLALVFIWLYKGRQGLHNKVVQIVCYAFYPAHMLILALIGMILT